ncbi:MAG: phage holin family protein [Actinobacteria bacterium]|nr:phage holin family protein [Actinomycetota bacterium]
MADSTVRRVPPDGADQSIGDLVSVAARDASQLIRYEIDLAKLELKSDVKRAAIGAVLAAVAAFAACLFLMLLSFALAYGLQNAGAPGGLPGAFVFAAVAVVVLIVIIAVLVVLIFRRLTRMGKTKRSLSDSASLLRHVKSAARSATKVG